MEVVLLASLFLLGKELSETPTQSCGRKKNVVLERNNKYPVKSTKITQDTFQNQPFFSSAKTQNTNDKVKNQYLETFTGNDKLMFQHKREVENDCMETKVAYGQVYGTQNLSNSQYNDEVNRYKGSMDGVNWMNNTLPFEQQKVGPGLNVDSNVAATGGFHDTFRILPDNVNSYKKNTFKGRVVSGKGEIGKPEERPTLASNRPDRFYCADKRPYMATKTNFSAPETRQEYNLQETNRGECNDFVGGPMYPNAFTKNFESTRIDDSTKCNLPTGQPYKPTGMYGEQSFFVHESDRESCGVVTNAYSNSGNTTQFPDAASMTQRGTQNNYTSNAHKESLGKYTNNYEAIITQRESSNDYNGNPNDPHGGTVRNHSANITQRGTQNTYSGILKGKQSMRDYTYELSADPYLSKESVLRSRAGGPQNVNVRDDADNIISNFCAKPDSNCIREPGHANMPGTYGELGDLESRPSLQEINRVDLDTSVQLRQNEFAMQPLHA
jgi:hypothetical protein